MVGAFCFLDSFGPLSFHSGKPMLVAPHPHIGLQTATWLLDGEVEHHDSLGFEGIARPKVLNLMTAGKGIAHSEETPSSNSGKLHGVQLWIALPDANRWIDPAFERYSDLPALESGGGSAVVILGELSGVRSPARAYSPLILAETTVHPRGVLRLPLRRDFEHALVPLRGECALDGEALSSLSSETLYYLGRGRREIAIAAGLEPATLLLLGGEPFGESVRMWWNFVARSAEEIAAAREDWVAGRRFGEVQAYTGKRLEAPPLASP
jgi:redox-sensitive bicupin YhaK (pirin superfamily)